MASRADATVSQRKLLEERLGHEKVLYHGDGITIYANYVPTFAINFIRSTKERLGQTHIVFYRIAPYEFECTEIMNTWGRQIACGAFKEAGLTVCFCADTHRYIMTDEKEKFQFALKYGREADK